MDAAKARGEHSIKLNFTPEQLADWRKAVAVAEAEAPSLIARMNRMDAARQEPGFSGALRRALAELEMPPAHAAKKAGVDPGAIFAFCEGTGVLSSDIIDQLVERLHLRIVLEPVQ